VTFKELATLSFVIDSASASVTINEAVAQFSNLIASAHAKAISQGGYGPT
jgi:hypothetical protein